MIRIGCIFVLVTANKDSPKIATKLNVYQESFPITSFEIYISITFPDSKLHGHG